MLLSGLPEQVANEENLARFLTYRSQFNSNGVKHSVFLPEREHKETSVYRHGSEPRESLWVVGEVATKGRNLYGAAIINAGQVRTAGLDVMADEPPPMHAVIRNWPWADDPVRQKAEQKKLALRLASDAQVLEK
jgi:hypothetical protein